MTKPLTEAELLARAKNDARTYGLLPTPEALLRLCLSADTREALAYLVAAVASIPRAIPAAPGWWVIRYDGPRITAADRVIAWEPYSPDEVRPVTQRGTEHEYPAQHEADLLDTEITKLRAFIETDR